MLAFITFLHVLCAVSFLGITIASLFYILHANKQHDTNLSLYALKASFYGDSLGFPIILILFATGTMMVYYHDLSLAVPWVFAAYVAFSVVTLLWYLNLMLKISQYKSLKKQDNGLFWFHWLFKINTILILCLLVFIVRDAVTKSTYFKFFN